MVSGDVPVLSFSKPGANDRKVVGEVLTDNERALSLVNGRFSSYLYVSGK